MTQAVFLDRDDTLIANRDVTANSPAPGDLVDPALVRLLPGVAAGCRRLKNLGFLLVVVSNQGGVARGVCGVADVERCNTRMQDVLHAEAGVRFDAVYYCPFHPRGIVPAFAREHPDRKPAPGMFLRAAQDWSISLPGSWMIGDAPRDIEAATKAGIPAAQAILISDGPDSHASSFADAVEFIIRRTSAATPP